MRIYFDGEARPNSTEGINRVCVVVVRRDRVSIIDERSGHGDSGVAEWKALVKAIETAKLHNLKQVEIIGDSKLVIEGAIRTPSIRKEWESFRDLYRQLSLTIPDVQLRWVPRDQNLAGRYLEAGDGPHFRNGVTAFEGLTAFTVVSGQLGKLNAYQRAKHNRKEKERRKRRKAEFQAVGQPSDPSRPELSSIGVEVDRCPKPK